jgi:hypothetical protein
MVLTAKVVPNLHERSIGQLFGQVHRQLPWQDHYSRCGSLVEFLHVHAEFAGYVLLDSLDLACRNFHRVERLHQAFFLREANLSVCCGSETRQGCYCGRRVAASINDFSAMTIAVSTKASMI